MCIAICDSYSLSVVSPFPCCQMQGMDRYKHVIVVSILVMMRCKSKNRIEAVSNEGNQSGYRRWLNKLNVSQMTRPIVMRQSVLVAKDVTFV